MAGKIDNPWANNPWAKGGEYYNKSAVGKATQYLPDGFLDTTESLQEWKERKNNDNNKQENSSEARIVEIIVTNKIVGSYEARSYPNDDYNDNGKIELYKVDLFEIQINGKDENSNGVIKKWMAPRFMPYWNNPKRPNSNYKTKGWVNAGLSEARTITVKRYIKDYEVRNRYSPGKGVIVLMGAFYIHGGPSSIDDYGFGSAGCIEIIGNYDDFKNDIKSLSGLSNKTSDEAIQELVMKGLLKVKIMKATPPNIRANFTREVQF